MPRIRWSTFALALILSCCGPSEIENTSTPTSAPPPASPAPQTPILRISEDVTELPVQYTTDDIQRVYDETSRTGRAQLETTDEYRKRRIEKQKSTVFVLEGRPQDYQYDADRQELLLDIAFRGGAEAGIPHDDSPAVLPIEISRTSEKYRGSNAFGVSVEVERTVRRHVGLAVTPIPTAFWATRVRTKFGPEGGNYIAARIPLKRGTASAVLRGDIRLIYWAPPSSRSSAPTFSGSYEWKPTLSSPTHRVSEYYGVLADVQTVRVWIVDKTSRTILMKTSISELMKNQPLADAGS